MKIVQLSIKIGIALVLSILLLVIIIISYVNFFSFHTDFWYVTHLRGNYELHEFDKAFYTLTLPGDKNIGGKNILKTILDGVVDYDIKNNYILMLSMKIRYDDMETIYTDKKEYWVLEYKTGKMIGPMTEPEFYRFRRNHGVLSVKLSVPDIYWSRCCKQ